MELGNLIFVEKSKPFLPPLYRELPTCKYEQLNQKQLKEKLLTRFANKVGGMGFDINREGSKVLNRFSITYQYELYKNILAYDVSIKNILECLKYIKKNKFQPYKVFSIWTNCISYPTVQDNYKVPYFIKVLSVQPKKGRYENCFFDFCFIKC